MAISYDPLSTLIAGIYFDFPQACFTLHGTAPMEVAHTTYGKSFPVTFEAAVAAQQFATVDPL